MTIEVDCVFVFSHIGRVQVNINSRVEYAKDFIAQLTLDNVNYVGITPKET